MIDTTDTPTTNYLTRGRFTSRRPPTTRPIPDALPDAPPLGANLWQVAEAMLQTRRYLEAAQERNQEVIRGCQLILDTPVPVRIVADAQSRDLDERQGAGPFDRRRTDRP